MRTRHPAWEKIMKFTRPLLLMLLVSTAPVMQAGEKVYASDPEKILEIVKGFGSADLVRDDAGDPNIIGRIDGTRYGVYFYGCKDHRNCTDIQLSAGWSGVKVSLSQLNEWNRGRRFGKAFLDDEGDPHLEMEINLDYGVDRDNLEDSLQWWRAGVREFIRTVLER